MQTAHAAQESCRAADPAWRSRAPADRVPPRQPVTDTTQIPDAATPAAADASSRPPDEFANVPSPRARHPILALLGVALALYLVWHVRDDVVYALSPGTPVDL